MKIVFVHFGKRTPKHLELNIERCLSLFPEIPVILITDKACKVPSIIGLETSYYTPDAKWHEIDKALSHPKDFRENFWLTSLARFLAIENYLMVNPNEILHVESDVILAKDFPFDRFTTLTKPLAFPVLSPTQGIASILYFRNYESAHALVKISLEMVSADSQTTDMLILRRFYDLNPGLIQALPIGPDELDIYRRTMSSELMKDMKNGSDQLGGVFDGLDFGYFIFGVDPRNQRGRRVVRKAIQTNFLQVEKTVLKFSKSRDFLSITSQNDGAELPIYSLHIHSKNPRIFNLRKSANNLRRGAEAYQQPPSSNLVAKVFLSSVLASIIRRMKGFKKNRSIL